jgi:hypothetical protein
MKLLLVVALLICASHASAATPTDWQVASHVSNTAAGFIDSIEVSLSTDLAVVRPTPGDGGVLLGILDDSFAGYMDAAVFTPSLPTSDAMVLGATSSFTVTFSQPVKDLIFHIYQLADNQLTFTEPFDVLSKTADLSTGATTVARCGPGPLTTLLDIASSYRSWSRIGALFFLSTMSTVSSTYRRR